MYRKEDETKERSLQTGESKDKAAQRRDEETARVCSAGDQSTSDRIRTGVYGTVRSGKLNGT